MILISIDYKKLTKLSMPMSTSWLLGSCMEARGQQELWIRQKPEVIDVLREQAIIQSAESSNRIEGVTIPADRLRPVVLGKAKPRNRSEEELAGYRQALNWIFSRKQSINITPELIKRLHAFAQGGLSADAGEWKKRNNEIIEILQNGERKIRFVPTSVNDTPRAMDILCQNYRDTEIDNLFPPLLLIATFVFDFLCIHPFRDGNGRVSRLITTLLLESNDFRVGRYVSMERLIEESKEEYYRILEECSHGWHEGKNEIIPWWNYFLSIVRRAYNEFKRQVESIDARPAKSDLVRQTILAQVEQFTLSDLMTQVPSASPQLIKKVLSELKDEKKVRLTGRGRGARWEKVL